MLLSRTRILGHKRIVLATAVVAAFVAFGALSLLGPSARTFGQSPGQSPHGMNASQHGVAVVDVSYIFKNHIRFKNSMEAMKKQMDDIEANLKAKRDQISKMEEARNQFTLGTDQYKKADDQLARAMAEFNLEMTQQRKEFLDREAKEYYKTYLEIVDAVSQYARARSIGMVIRFNGEPVDPNRREDVLREINKPVVFQNQVDITPDVLALLNRDAGGFTGNTPGRPTQPLQGGVPGPGQPGPTLPQQPQVGTRPTGAGSMLPIK